jgi:hypothetical protein
MEGGGIVYTATRDPELVGWEAGPLGAEPCGGHDLPVSYDLLHTITAPWHRARVDPIGRFGKSYDRRKRLQMLIVVKEKKIRKMLLSIEKCNLSILRRNFQA